MNRRTIPKAYQSELCRSKEMNLRRRLTRAMYSLNVRCKIECVGTGAKPSGSGTPILRLPIELRTDLADARRLRIGYNSEAPAVVDIASRIRELRMVEDVEKFDAQIKRHLLSNDGSLQYAEVGVVESRPVEKAPVGGAKRS